MAADRDTRSLEIRRYYVRVGSAEIADRILRDIVRASDGVGECYNLGRKRDESVFGLWSATMQSYTVFYRMSEARVEIARVLHEHRNFPELFYRPRVGM